MPFPQFPNKHQGHSITSAEEFMEYAKKQGTYPSLPAPDTLIILFSGSSIKTLRTQFPTTNCDGMFKKIEYVSGTNHRLALLGRPGIGAPMVTTYLEELAAFGVKNIVTLGSAGCLQKDMAPGDIVICDSAIRDDGVSHHYAADERLALPDTELTAEIASAYDKENLNFRKGGTWTIDAPYRETVEELKAYQQEGFLTVEMEAAAVFAVAKVRGMRAAAAFVVSDSLAEGKWQPHFHNKKKHDALSATGSALISHFSKKLKQES